MIKYKSFKQSKKVENTSGGSLSIQPIITWTDEDGCPRIKETHFIVSGELKEKDKTWTDEWDFICPEEEISKISGAIIELEGSTRGQNSHLRNEVYVEINQWLRIGFVCEENKWQGFFEFSKDDQLMTIYVPYLQEITDYIRI